ncbi:MAG: 1-(5-phosphoribosyl)-5-[(5-phosphoribosylamino)methylideneamino]imidazole-4-carboxamide isomerase [Chloroflexota bacterium]|nr:1-(5-phosphoribosyl)-5-[(5-phosphoribosylamino)methylideneamino]imidazole-4-carboxamide isomerase [Chloroflexota bacterium]
MNLIPAIDLIDGEVVRLFKGDYAKKTVYDIDPIELTEQWNEMGIKRIHIVDLQGAKTGNQKNLDTIKNIVKLTNLKIQIGGGIRNLSVCKKMMDLGVSKVIFGTAAIESPEEVEKSLKEYGHEKIIIGVDIKKNKIRTNGWEKESSLAPDELIDNMTKIGIKEFMFTDVEKDGTLSDPDFSFLKNLFDKAGNKTIVAGGISKINHIKTLKNYGIKNIVIGKAIYEGQINLKIALQNV